MTQNRAPYSVTILPDKPTDVRNAPINRVREGALEPTELRQMPPITPRPIVPQQQHSCYAQEQLGGQPLQRLLHFNLAEVRTQEGLFARAEEERERARQQDASGWDL